MHATETSTFSRNLRILPSYATALPDYSGHAVSENGTVEAEEYDIVVVGAGPAGLMLTLLLSRYGLTDTRLLCIDSKPGTLRSGQADGLQPRTLEVLKSLGLSEEILTDGCQMWEVAFWNPKVGGGIERTAYVPDVAVPARFPHEVTIHQGRIERILSDDLKRYSDRSVQFSTILKSLGFDDNSGHAFPVVLEVELTAQDGTKTTKTIRAKYVCGADGAHSVVRREIGLDLVGESKDHIWGVTDFVVDTDFPDIRRRTAIHSQAGSVMVIPRERVANGDYLTRLYVQVDDDDVPSEASNGTETQAEKDRKAKARAKRSKVSFESILAQAQKVLAPYKLTLKEGANIDWWTAYQIGQRVTENFIKKDSSGVPRVFILGDACHTHSPKAGQGMNISMMDAYNLAWKLAYHVKGLVPQKTHQASSELLQTYQTERRKIAQELIDFDTRFSSMFSGRIGFGTRDGDAAQELTHEQFLEVFSQGNGFTSGCGIEYAESGLVIPLSTSRSPVKAVENEREYLEGVLRPGRRLLDVRVVRHADSNPRALQDDFPSTGRFRLLVLTSRDLLDKQGRSSSALRVSGQMIESFPANTIELTVLHCLSGIRGILWSDLPPEIVKYAEMRFHSAIPGDVPADPGAIKKKRYGAEDAYKIYGVDPIKGAVVVVRPDGYIGMVISLEDVGRIEEYLGRWLRRRG